MKFPAAAAALIASCSLSALAAEEKTEFIRVNEDAAAARLQTAVTRYEKDGATVDLIGAIHIADKAYYADLTKRFTGYERLLFEMVGGEKFDHPEAGAAAPAPAPAPEEPGKHKDMSGLHKIYNLVASFLKLAGQTTEIDYMTGNFVHADLTTAEFEKLQKERGESLLGFAMKAGAQDQNGKQPDPMKLMTALMSGNPNQVKLEIVHTLGEGDDQIAAFAGESVIISDRNNRCLDVLERELKAGHKNLGIFYGAAHFPDMEKRLVEKGFKRAKQEWITAWDIPKAKAAEAPAEPKKAA